MNRNIFLHTLAISLLTALISGCSTSSGVVSVGQDTYMVARTHKGTGGSAAPVKADALKEADDYCKKHGKVMKLIKTVQKDMKPFQSDAAAEVYFKCLDPKDPELKTNTVVEEIRE